MGRWLLFHINTGLFWIYGLLTFFLAFLASSLCVESVTTRMLLSLPCTILAAFTLARLVHALFWHRFRNVWMDNYNIGVFLVAILLDGYALEVRDGREDALIRLAKRALMAVIAGLVSYVSNRKRAACLLYLETLSAVLGRQVGRGNSPLRRSGLV